jgi:hypothetical protein
MSRIQKIVTAAIVGIGLLLGWLFLRRHNQGQDVNNAQTSLRPGEESAVIINPIHRSITIVRPDGKTHTVDLPDRPSRISLLKGDGFKVSAPQWGTEVRPFLIGAYDLKGGKLGLGVDGFYWKRLDIGAGALVNPSFVQDTSVFIGVSCFVYSNTSVMLGIDNHTSPLIAIKVRF